jgi:hypothetical protein
VVVQVALRLSYHRPTTGPLQPSITPPNPMVAPIEGGVMGRRVRNLFRVLTGLVIIAILAFAATIRGFNVTLFGLHIVMPQFGLVPATFLAFMISILGSTEMRWLESLIAAAAMTAFCVLLFIYLLNLPFQLWPRF